MGGSQSHLGQQVTGPVETCNNYAQLCDRPYSNVTQVGAHDSAFVGILPTQNQYSDVTSQLDMGIRFLQMQVHDLDGTLELCHTTCTEEDAGPLQNYLGDVRTWLDDNEWQVVTLLLVNGDNKPASQFADAFGSAGLDKYLFSPPHNSNGPQAIGPKDWPTMKEMIEGGNRLVVFMDTGANLSAAPWLSDEFTYFFETPYDTTDPSFNQCTIDRPKGLQYDGRMYIVNHFLDFDLFDTGILVPNAAEAGTTNSVNSILAQADLCSKQYATYPKFILLDYVDIGQAIEAQNIMNGIAP